MRHDKTASILSEANLQRNLEVCTYDDWELLWSAVPGAGAGSVAPLGQHTKALGQPAQQGVETLKLPPKAAGNHNVASGCLHCNLNPCNASLCDTSTY